MSTPANTQACQPQPASLASLPPPLPPFLRTPRASTLLPSFLRIAAAHGRSHVLPVPNVQQYPASAAAAAATAPAPATTTATTTTAAAAAAAATATATATTTAGSGPGSAAPGDPSKHASVRHRPGQGMADAANAAAIQTTTVQRYESCQSCPSAFFLSHSHRPDRPLRGSPVVSALFSPLLSPLCSLLSPSSPN